MADRNKLADPKGMQPITREELRWLLDQTPDVALSIYHPTERVAVEPEQNSLRLKNLLGVAQERLAEHGLRRPDIERLLEPANGLLADNEFWHHQLEGLSVFIAPDVFRYYRLPFEVEELVVVADLFHTKPLLPALATDGHFYVLALSQGTVRLLRCTRFGVEEIDLSDLGIPRSLAEALQYDDLQKPDLKHHPTTGPGSAGGPAGEARLGGGRQGAGRKHAFHGHGESGEGQKTEIRRYFHAVDAGLSRLLATEHAPMVIAAVDYLHPLYKEASSYRHILEQGVEGNPDQLSAAQLHEKAWPVVEPQLRAHIDAALERWHSGAPNGLSSCDLEEILRAIQLNRVDSLFVRRGEERWGSFDPSDQTVTVHAEYEPGDVDLLDLASRETLRRAGSVYLRAAEEMPCDGPLAAVYRF